MPQKRINPARQAIIDARHQRTRLEVWRREAEEKHRKGMLRRTCRQALGKLLIQQIEANGMALLDQWGFPVKDGEKQEALEYLQSIAATLQSGSQCLPS